jgi:hypothetical protein
MVFPVGFPSKLPEVGTTIFVAMAWRSAFSPSMGAYWLNPPATASVTQAARSGSMG